MRVSAATLAVLALVAICPSVAAQTAQERGRLRISVTDSSGGALPGATVVATATNGRIIGTHVTDGSGRSVFPALPSGVINLTFQLEGFAEAAVSLVVEPGVESRVVQRLELASLSETVVVRAPAAVDHPIARFEAPPVPPRLVATPLPAHDRAAVCGPAKPDPFSQPLGTIKSSRHEIQGELYLAEAQLVSMGTAGWVCWCNSRRQALLPRARHGVVTCWPSTPRSDTDRRRGRASSVAVVSALRRVRKGDFLASFKPEPVRDPDPVGTPAFYDAARILFADEGQTLAAPPRQMVIDRGSDHDTRVGQRFTLFHQQGAGRRTIGGDAVVVAVRSDSATIRIDHITDAIMAGDWAAPQSATSAHRDQR